MRDNELRPGWQKAARAVSFGLPGRCRAACRYDLRGPNAAGCETAAGVGKFVGIFVVVRVECA